MKQRLLITAVCVLSLVSPVASATLNVPVAARMLSFVQPAPSEIIPVANVYQAGNVDSE